MLPSHVWTATIPDWRGSWEFLLDRDLALGKGGFQKNCLSTCSSTSRSYWPPQLASRSKQRLHAWGGECQEEETTASFLSSAVRGFQSPVPLSRSILGFISMALEVSTFIMLPNSHRVSLGYTCQVWGQHTIRGFWSILLGVNQSLPPNEVVRGNFPD